MACVLVLLAGCGGTVRVAVPTPRSVPPGAVAIVGAVPVTTASIDHWVAILSKAQPAAGTTAGTRREAVQRVVSFLVKAQWLLQESHTERINQSVLNKLVSQQTANAQQSPQSRMTRSDLAFQARLNLVAEALQSRHATVSVRSPGIARYYATHRSQLVNPAVRDTLMVVTHDRASAQRARAALAAGQPWAAVAKRSSIDSSALNGGAYAVVEGVQSPALVHAVFAARPGQLTGPVRATPAAQPNVSDYYLFKVTGGHPASPQPLAQVTAQIRQTLTAQQRPRALAVFTREYELRWRARTLCAPGYVVAECRNAVTTTRG
jgi:parvulin-like peptidyl-prolyl isomerase